MTVKEFYEKIGGGYETAIAQLRKEERIAKYLGMFLRDDSFQLLKTSMESGNMEEAFRGAHTLKGVSANLALVQLRDLVSELTEDLRGGKDLDAAKLHYPKVVDCYEEVIAAIRELTAQ